MSIIHINYTYYSCIVYISGMSRVKLVYIYIEASEWLVALLEVDIAQLIGGQDHLGGGGGRDHGREFPLHRIQDHLMQ